MYATIIPTPPCPEKGAACFVPPTKDTVYSNYDHNYVKEVYTNTCCQTASENCSLALSPVILPSDIYGVKASISDILFPVLTGPKTDPNETSISCSSLSGGYSATFDIINAESKHMNLTIPTYRSCSLNQERSSCECKVTSPLTIGPLENSQAGFSIGIHDKDLISSKINGILAQKNSFNRLTSASMMKVSTDAASAPGSVILNVFCSHLDGQCSDTEFVDLRFFANTKLHKTPSNVQ